MMKVSGSSYSCWTFVVHYTILVFIQTVTLVQSLSSKSSSSASSSFLSQPWYTSDKLDRSIPNDRPFTFSKHDADDADDATAKIVLLSNDDKGRLTVYHDRNTQTGSVRPAYFAWKDVHQLLMASSHSDSDSDTTTRLRLLEEAMMWIGNDGTFDFWALDLGDWDIAHELLQTTVTHDEADSSQCWTRVDWPLREFGDILESTDDAAILATSFGLAQFHKMHPFCNACGSKTKFIRKGAARSCTNCATRIYPRINVATIFLITHGDYALLGRKHFWPPGRYSTLAGFLDVGETLEQCIVRETFEESGVHVDPSSITFHASQPWPFPNSFMVGFHATALHNNNKNNNNNNHHHDLPPIHVHPDEMEDVQWFHKDYVAARLQGGSTALEQYQTLSEAEQQFHIPGKASLARILITKWALAENQSKS